MKRLHWEWLAAIAVGLTAGLAYAWVAAPLRNTDMYPSSLRADFKDQFRTAIAAAYAATGDLERARARLALLGDPDSSQALSAQAQRALAAGLPFGQAQELARLASDLQSGHSSISAAAPAARGTEAIASSVVPGPAGDESSSQPAATSTPHAASAATAALAPTQLPTPTVTSIPSPEAAFQLAVREEVCDAALPAGLLQITVSDDQGRPFPGIEIAITWSNGEERFFTGLQPEISDGYADYVMQAETIYSVRVARLGAPVSDLSAPVCDGPGGTTYLGGLQLTFKEP